MILTCPNCATRYSLPDGSVGPQGRKVKCVQCGEVWREAPPADAAQTPAAAPARAGADTAGATAAGDPAQTTATIPAPAPAVARRAAILREKKGTAERKAVQSATISAAVWAGLAAAIALILGLAVVFRETVVKLAPGVATAYAKVGLPVNSAGLLIEGVKAAPGVLLGHKVLMVTGQLRNVAAGPMPPPAFRIDILDGAGRPLDHRTVLIQAPVLKQGEARSFSLAIDEPPPGAQDVDLTFSAPRPAAPAAAPEHH